VAQTNTLDTYFGKVQKQVCIAGVGMPVRAAVQVPTLGELIADAAARASETLSERIAKAESLLMILQMILKSEVASIPSAKLA
jgi:hypothetical protein